MIHNGTVCYSHSYYNLITCSTIRDRLEADFQACVIPRCYMRLSRVQFIQHSPLILKRAFHDIYETGMIRRHGWHSGMTKLTKIGEKMQQ